MKDLIWDNILSLREKKPLVHNITNYVVMNNTANALLAVGASPVMAHAHSEMEDMVKIASSVVINIGTLDEYWEESMRLAAHYALRYHKPWILDPVGAGATPFRDQIVQSLLKHKPKAIRGNASEILAVGKANSLATKGVDSTHASEDALEAAKWINEQVGSVVTISGARDIVIDRDRVAYISNGDPLMASVTGLGCTASALLGAFLPVVPNAFVASVSAMALLGVCGELAARKAEGPGTLQLLLLDKLHNLKEDEFKGLLNLEVYG